MLSVKTLSAVLFGFMILAGAVSVMAEEGTTTITTETGLTLTPVPEEIIKQAAYGILINTMDKENVISEKNGGRILGSLGDKVKDFCLIPIYDINGVVVKYYALGYAGDGEIKNLDELFNCYFISFDVWKKYREYLQEVELSIKKMKELNFSASDGKEEIDSIKTKYKDVIDIVQYNYPKDAHEYLHVTIGAFYEIPPGQYSADEGIPSFIRQYWNCYYSIKEEFNTDNITFVAFAYDRDCMLMYQFKVDDQYVYASICSGSYQYDTKIIEKDDFEGLDINKINSDCPLLIYSQNVKEKLWDSALDNYRKSQEGQNLNGCRDFYWEIFDDILLPDYYQSYYDFYGQGCSYASAANTMLIFDAFFNIDYSYSWTLGASPDDYTVYNQVYGIDYQNWSNDWLGGLPPEQPPSVISQSMHSFWESYVYNIPCFVYEDLDPYLSMIEMNLTEQKPVWIGIPQFGDNDPVYQLGDHSAYVFGYNLGKDELIVYDFNEYLDTGPVWEHYHEINYVTWDDGIDFQVIYVDPGVGISCTLAYFLGVAGANNVELGFSCDAPPDPSFQGFQLCRANNKFL